MEQNNDQNGNKPAEPAGTQITPQAPVAAPAAAEPGQSPAVKSNLKKRGLIAGIFLVVVVAAAAFLLMNHKSKSPKTAQLTNVSVRLEWLNGPEFTGMYMAQDKGFYAAEGLNIDIREFTDSTDVNKEVAAGQENFGVSTPLEVILARDKGEKNKAIAAVMQSSPYAFAARKDANIKSPTDFKGKILGNIGDNNEAKVTYSVLLANAGLKPSDTTIKTVDYDVVKVFQDHESDTADIYRTDQTFLLDQAKVDYTLIYPEQFGFSIYGDILIASDNQINQHPAQTGAFVRATMKGWQYAIDHQDEALASLVKHRNDFYKTPGYDKYSLETTAPLIKPTGSQSLGAMQFVTWNRAYNGVKETGLLKNDFSVSDIYTSEFVR